MGNVINLYKQEPQEQGTGLPKVIQYVDPSSLVEHEESQRIPEMAAEEWVDFFESVRSRNQVIEPLSVLPDGRVYDGRHRLKAAKELGLRFVPVIFYDISEDEALQRMSDSAVLRRSLTKGQRAAIVLEFSEMVEELRREARDNQGTRTDLLPELAKGNPKHTHVELAEKAGIGKSSMQYLMSVQRDAPDLFDKVKAGEITINKAYMEKKKREKVRAGDCEGKEQPKPNKARLSKVIKAVKEEKTSLPLDPTRDALDPVNILRERANNLIPQFTIDCVHDYELLLQADSDTVQAYTNQLMSVTEGALLLLEMFELNDKRRVFFEFLSKMFTVSKDGDKLNEFINKIGGILHEEE